MRTPLATHLRACQVQSGISGLPVAVQVGAFLLGRWLQPRVRQHSALSAVSWRSDLLGAENTQQLRQQNLSSRWTSLVKLSSGPAAQSRHHLQTTAERPPSRQAWTRSSVISDMRRLRKTLTYLLIIIILLTRPVETNCDTTRRSAIAKRPHCRVRYSFGQKWKTGTRRP